MTIVLLDDVVHTAYGSFTLTDTGEIFDGDAERFFADQANGWVGAAVGGVVHVALARWGGGSAVRIELLDAEPPVGDAEDIVEGIVDRYLLQFWPAPVEQDAILRVESENAAYWNRAWGGRRA